jgi:hypothetical protein
LVKGIGRVGFGSCPPAGLNTGPNPTQRGRSATKHHILVDLEGAPLTVLQSGANVHDSMMVEEVVDSVEPIKGSGRGRPRSALRRLMATRPTATGSAAGPSVWRGIKCRIARKGVESSERLGRYRWVVERTIISWLGCYRRPGVGYERRDEIHRAFLDLGWSLICWNQLQRLC